MKWTAKDLVNQHTAPRCSRRFNNEEKEKTLYLDFELWWEDIIEPCVYFECLSYTAKIDKLKKCRRLIVAKPIPDLHTFRNKKLEVRYIENLHTKLYIVHKRFKQKTIWVGSGNCVDSTFWLNIMTKVEGKDARTLLKHFEWCWNKATCKLTH